VQANVILDRALACLLSSFITGYATDGLLHVASISVLEE